MKIIEIDPMNQVLCKMDIRHKKIKEQSKNKYNREPDLWELHEVERRNFMRWMEVKR